MNDTKQQWQCRYAPSLGALESTPEKIWGTTAYEDREAPTVFFGLYGLRDFMALWEHKGKKAILWAGSDIRHFVNGYWLDEKGHIRLSRMPLARWIIENCESYVENEIEAHLLAEAAGIKATVIPSFLGDVNEYEVSYQQADRPKVYLSCSGDNFQMYGWSLIEEIADQCEVDFYLYGSDNWQSKHPNVIVRGKVPKEVMNEEIKRMQCGLRLNTFDGFSEITAKSVLWAQYPISLIKYPNVLGAEGESHLIYLLNDLKNRKEPNLDARNYYLSIINRFPWNKNV